MDRLKARVAGIDTGRARDMGKKVVVFAATRRLLKAVPLLGPVVAAYAGYSNVKRKGWVRGGVDTALDLTPVVGRAKAVYELFLGEIIPVAAANSRPR